MLHWTPYIFVRITFFLIVGIMTGVFVESNQIAYWTVALGIFSLIYVGLRFFLPAKSLWLWRGMLGLTAALVMVILGVLRTYQANETHYSSHILHQPKILAYRALLQTDLETKAKTYKTEAQINLIKTELGWQPARARVLLYLRRDSAQIQPNLRYGSEILVMGAPQIVPAPKNPQEFDYQQFLKNQNIYHQHFIKTSQYQKIRQTTPNYLIYWTLQLREISRQALQKLVDSPQEAAIAVALILGVKEQMDEEIKTAYANTGLMHVLAVSGMHVAFLLIILEFLLARLQKLPNGKYIYAAAIIVLLWLYALVTGLSASVLRAVVMFSFVAWGDAMGRKRLIYNNIAISAFVLLVYNPYFLWSVGFQLSYLAVLGIVYLQPKIYRLWEVENYYLDQIWQLISVSLAAQLLTFPLGLYYFQQFPNYFLLSNLLIVPLSGWAMWAGVVTLAVAWLPGVNYLAGQVLRGLIYAMNQITFFLEDLPYSLTEGIYINLWETYLSYFIILCVAWLGIYRRFRYWIWAFGALLIWMGIRIERGYEQNFQNQLVMYQVNRHAVWGFLEGKKALFLADSAMQTDANAFNFSVQPSLAYRGIRQVQWLDWEKSPSLAANLSIKHFDQYSLLVWQQKTFLILRKKLKLSALKPLANAKIDYVVIQNNAIFDLEKLHNLLNIKYLILDSSNSNTRALKLAQDAKTLKIKVFSMYQKGAWILGKF
jgi:competence protein ComEC